MSIIQFFKTADNGKVGNYKAFLHNNLPFYLPVISEAGV